MSMLNWQYFQLKKAKMIESNGIPLDIKFGNIEKKKDCTFGVLTYRCCYHMIISEQN